MNSKQEELHNYIEKNHKNICGIVAMKKGKMVYSDYWNGFKPEDTTHVMSVTKSVVSLLIGIAIHKGLILDVEQKVLEFFPDYKVKRGEKTIQSVTIKHLLTMTAPYKYRSEPWTKVCTSNDWTQAALDLLGGRGGITGTFRYSTLGIHILTGILAKVSGMNTVEFANKYLFEPIGVASHQNYLADTAEEHKEFMLSKEPKENLWFADPMGIATAGYGLCLSALDMAKIGQLCLDGGIYNGKSIISSKWIKESTKPHYQCDDMYNNMAYGYLWWIPEVSKSAYAALGNGGNIIYINPEQDMVVAINCTFKAGIFDRVQLIQEYVEPLLKDC